MIECQRCFEAAGRPRLVSSAINVRGLIAADNDEIDDAEALYTEAIAKASSVKATTEVAYVRHDLGALLLRTRRANEAIEELRFAADHWAETGHPMLHAKSAACLGIAILDAGGPREEPTQIADAGLELLRSGAVTGEHPQAWLWHLAELLQRLDRPGHRADVVVAAHDELVRQAHAIEDPVRRRQFFELVPLNRSIAAAHAELDHRTTTASTTARLARADAPLGRVLRADELVEVNLTVHTAADEAFDEPARRRHRLRRLLTEADTQGAAPTDDQLAELLLVSRRTILRDMAELEREGVVTATRRRRRRPASPNRGAGSSHS
jgi:hypothetical protein